MKNLLIFRQMPSSLSFNGSTAQIEPWPSQCPASTPLGLPTLFSSSWFVRAPGHPWTHCLPILFPALRLPSGCPAKVFLATRKSGIRCTCPAHRRRINLIWVVISEALNNWCNLSYSRYFLFINRAKDFPQNLSLESVQQLRGSPRDAPRRIAVTDDCANQRFI